MVTNGGAGEMERGFLNGSASATPNLWLNLTRAVFKESVCARR